MQFLLSFTTAMFCLQEYFFPSEDAPAKRQEAWVKSVALAAHRNRKAAAQAMSTSGSGKMTEAEAGGSGTVTPTKMPRAGSGKQPTSVPASPAPPGQLRSILWRAAVQGYSGCQHIEEITAVADALAGK